MKKKNKFIVLSTIFSLIAGSMFLPAGFAFATTCPSCEYVSFFFSKNVNKDDVQTEDILTYTIHYQNTGNAKATNVVIYDDYDERYLDIYDNGGGSVSGGKITWNIGTVSAGSSGNVSFRARIKCDIPYTDYQNTTYIDNIATIDSSQTNPKKSNPVRVEVVDECCPRPEVDIKANGSDGPISVPYNHSVNLTWNFTNADYCYASGDWSGTKSLSGSQSTYGLSSSKTYTITCTSSCGSASDSVIVNVGTGYLSVNLNANPNSGCKPLKDVDLKASVSGTASGTIKYKFDCTNNGTWNKIVNTSNTSYTAYDLCDYSSSKTYTARVRVERDGLSDEDTVKIEVSDCEKGCFNITKSVKNLSDGTSWANSVSADLNEMISFKIKVKAESNTSLNDVIVRDVLPEGIIYRGSLKIDGVSVGGSISSGLNIGDLDDGESKEITFNAQIAGSSSFNYGRTQIINTAYGDAVECSDSDTAVVYVDKTGVGGATTVITGLTNNLLVDSFLLPLLIALLLIWLFKSHILRLEEKLDFAKQRYGDYKAKKLLQFKITRIKAGEAKDKEYFEKK